tara:strand:+ start:19 stop:237 length:219 start_codon:yes stop_codon:yes gene_type:complete
MQLERTPERISETGLRQIHQLTDKYYRTGELSPSLVKDHLEGESPHVLTMRVPAKLIFWDQNDLNEFGYDPR